LTTFTYKGCSYNRHTSYKVNIIKEVRKSHDVIDKAKPKSTHLAYYSWVAILLIYLVLETANQQALSVTNDSCL